MLSAAGQLGAGQLGAGQLGEQTQKHVKHRRVGGYCVCSPN